MFRLFTLGSLLTLVFVASPASAFEIDLNWEALYTDATLANLVPGFSVTPDGDGAVLPTIAAGQVLSLTVDVANPTGEFVQGVFASLVTDNSGLQLLGRSLAPAILEGGTISNPVGLGAITPIAEIKGNSPAGADWIQALAFASPAGSSEVGPTPIAVRIFLQVLDPNALLGGGLPFMALTAGDIIGGGGNRFTPFVSGIFVVPEPSSAILIGLGLISLGSFRDRKRKH